ncbi:MAG: phage holin family protein [Chitinophagales bacterium]
MINFLIRLLINSLAVLISSHLIPGIYPVSPYWSILIAAVLVIVNTLMKPFMIILTSPFAIFSFTVIIVIINSLVMYLTCKLTGGFIIDTVWAALGFSIIFSIMLPILEAAAEQADH